MTEHHGRFPRGTRGVQAIFRYDLIVTAKRCLSRQSKIQLVVFCSAKARPESKSISKKRAAEHYRRCAFDEIAAKQHLVSVLQLARLASHNDPLAVMSSD